MIKIISSISQDTFENMVNEAIKERYFVEWETFKVTTAVTRDVEVPEEDIISHKFYIIVRTSP